MQLRYDIEVIGQAKLRRAMRGIERELKQHAASTDRIAAKSTGRGGPYRSPATAAENKRHRDTMRHRTVEKGHALRGFYEIARAARAADLKVHRDRMRNIEREKRAEIRAAKQAQAARQRAAVNMGRGLGRSAAGAVGGVVRMGAGMVGLAGGMMVGEAVRHRMGVSTMATQMANRAALVPGETRSRGEMAASFMRTTRDVEKLSGRDQAVILEGMDKFFEKTGATKAGEEVIPELSQLADAVGLVDEQFKDLAQASGIVYAGLKEQGLSEEQAAAGALKVARAGAKQSAIGQISLGDLAREMPKLIAASSRMGGDQSENLSQMVALANIATAVAAKGPEEAGTAVVRMTDDLIQNSKKFEKMGVKVFDEGGELRSMRDLMPEIMKATGGDMTQLKDLFGMRGRKTSEGFAKIARTSKSPEEAQAKILASIDKFLGQEMTKEDVKKGADAMQKSEARKIAKSFQDLRRAMADDFVPVVINDLLPALQDLAPVIKDGSKYLAEFVSWFAKNPLKGIGAIVLASVAKDIAGAGIGKGLGAALKALVAGSGAGVPGGGAGAGAGAGLGTAAAGAAALAGVALAGDQASKLAKEVGSDVSLTKMLPGMGSGEFNSDNLLEDLVTGGAGRRALEGVWQMGSDVVNYDENLNAKARKEAAERKPQEDATAASEALKKGAGEAGDILVSKLKAWQPPGDGKREGTPIVKR